MHCSIYEGVMCIAVPSGIEVVFHELAVDCTQHLAGSSTSPMLTPLQVDVSDTFTILQEQRGHHALFRNTETRIDQAGPSGSLGSPSDRRSDPGIIFHCGSVI